MELGLYRDFHQAVPYLGCSLEKCAEAKRSATNPSSKDKIIDVVAGILLINCSQRTNLFQRFVIYFTILEPAMFQKSK